MYLAKVHIVLKPVVNDPQGLTIKSDLAQSGFQPGLRRSRWQIYRNQSSNGGAG